MKKSIQLTEHILIPLVLACLNIGVVHLLYLFAGQGSAFSGDKILVALALVFLTGGIIYKKQWLLAGSVVFYLAVLLTGLLG
jgi:hypothetical protein